jgi:hypothetical protein
LGTAQETEALFAPAETTTPIHIGSGGLRTA